MPMLALPELPQVDKSCFDYSRRSVACAVQAAGSGFSRYDVLRRDIREISTPESHYRLREPVTVQVVPAFSEGGYRVASSVFPSILGTGATPHDAFVSFRDEVHRSIQDLLAKRPFEMNDSELALWTRIQDSIDLADYLRRTPLRLRQLGTLTGERRGQASVRWEGFVGREIVDLQKFPDEFARYRVGQPFEAISLRDRQTMQLIKVVYVSRREVPRPTEQKKAELWESMGNASQLDRCEWG